MGFVREEHGKVTIEERRESFTIHYGYRCWACGDPIDLGDGVRVAGGPGAETAGLTRIVHHAGPCRKAAQRLRRDQSHGGTT